MNLVPAVALLVAAASALAAAAALGGVVSKNLDLFAQATPLWLSTAVVALVLQLLAGAGPLTTIPAVAAIATGAWLIGPDVFTRLMAPRTAPGRQSLKLIQFNVWDLNRDPTATARWILAEDADIVILEEMGDGAIPAALAVRYPHRTPNEGSRATMILSKTSHNGGGVITWPGLGPRNAGAWADFGSGADAFTVAGIHYRWPLPAGPQEEQARRFAEELVRFDRRSLIVAGDFNLNPWSFALRRQDARLGIPRLTHAIFTCPAAPVTRWRLNSPFPLLAIDHIYAGASWQPVSVVRGPRLGSDHYPIVAILTR